MRVSLLCVYADFVTAWLVVSYLSSLLCFSVFKASYMLIFRSQGRVCFKLIHFCVLWRLFVVQECECWAVT